MKHAASTPAAVCEIVCAFAEPFSFLTAVSSAAVLALTSKLEARVAARSSLRCQLPTAPLQLRVSQFAETLRLFCSCSCAALRRTMPDGTSQTIREGTQIVRHNNYQLGHRAQHALWLASAAASCSRRSIKSRIIVVTLTKDPQTLRKLTMTASSKTKPNHVAGGKQRRAGVQQIGSAGKNLASSARPVIISKAFCKATSSCSRT